ncbi:hypothetical protein Tco_0450066 [Tanacetum coccineum]
MDEPEPHPREMGEPLGAEADEPMVGPVVDEIAEPIVGVEEQMVALDDEEVWVVNEEWLMAPVTPPPMPVMPPPSTYKLVKKVIQVSDAEVADGIAIGEIGPRVSAVEGQVQVMASQMVQAVGRLKQVGTQMEQGQQVETQRDETIEGLSHRESTLMQCILGMDRRLANLKRRPPGPQ